MNHDPAVPAVNARRAWRTARSGTIGGAAGRGAAGGSMVMGSELDLNSVRGGGLLKPRVTPLIAILAVTFVVPAWGEYEYGEATDAYGQFWEIAGPDAWVGVVEGEYYTYEVALEEYVVVVDNEIANVPLECYLYDATEEPSMYLEGSEVWLEYAGDVAAWDLGVGTYLVECEVMIEGLELLDIHILYVMTQEEYDETLRALDEPGSAPREETGGGAAGIVDLPPVFLKHPESETVTPMGNHYTLSLNENDFIVIDDGDFMIDCTANTITDTLGSTPSLWRLGAGLHDVQCTVTDTGGKTNSISYTITVVATASLYASEGYEQRLERIARLGAVGALNDEHVLKAVKYFHRAGAMIFDIGSSDGMGEAPAQPVCSSPVTADSVIGAMANTDHTDEQVKHCLELLAEQGDFSGVSLGI